MDKETIHTNRQSKPKVNVTSKQTRILFKEEKTNNQTGRSEKQTFRTNRLSGKQTFRTNAPDTLRTSILC